MPSRVSNPNCGSCRADLHVCKLCEFYATGIANDCREPIAERVVNKERANFCGYFKLRPGGYQVTAEAASARHALEAMFGGANVAASAQTVDAAQAALEDLFKPP
jgi:hypothetical protein